MRYSTGDAVTEVQSPVVLRMLDIDLDFFVRGVAYWPTQTERLDDTDYPAWSLEDAIVFLEERCALTGPLPGFVVTNHGELFARWRTAIESGALTAPFSVTHVDAHADLGMGDLGYLHLMTELLFEEPENRCYPEMGIRGLGDGNFLAFAIACRWLSDLLVVYNDDGGNDVMRYHMQNFDITAENLQLKAVRPDEMKEKLLGGNPAAERTEPLVPFATTSWNLYQARVPFDVICLAQSPPYTPAGADAIFDEIRHRFIDESAFSI